MIYLLVENYKQRFPRFSCCPNSLLSFTFLQVFIPLQLYLDARRIFECVKENGQKGFVPKQDSKIDYTSLSSGNLPEVRHVFARVVFDTVFPLNPSQEL